MKVCLNGSKEIVFEVGMLLEEELGKDLKEKILKMTLKKGLSKDQPSS